VLLRRAVAAAIFFHRVPYLAPRGTPIHRCAPSRATPPPSPRHASSPIVPALARCVSRPGCCTPCPIPCARRGATRVLQTPSPARAEVLLGCYRRHSSPPEGRGRCRCRGCRDARPQQGDVAMKAHVASVCFKCFRRFRDMLQLFHMGVVKVDQRCCTCCML
jgi:hypothetical protein